MHLVTRAWTALAPKLVAFLATGLTTSGLIWAAHLFGLQISAELATIVVGLVSSTAAYIQRDELLLLAPGQLSLKVVAFLVTSVSGATVVAIVDELGVDLTEWAPAITAALTLVGALLGYRQPDVSAGAARAAAL